jgi:hypothetical protein
MKLFIKIIILFVVIFVALGFVFAVDVINAQAEDTSGTVTLDNPLSFETPQELIGGIITYLMGLVGILAVAALVWGGIMYMTSAGSEERVKQAKNIITYAIIGLVVAVLSYIIVNTVIQAIGG